MRKILLLFALLWSLWPSLGHAQVIGVQPTPIGLYGWNSNSNSFVQTPNTYALFPAQSTPQPFAFYGWNSTLHQWVPCDTVTVSCPINGVGLNVSFSAITSGQNNQAVMTVGPGASLGYVTGGSINASAIAGCQISGTPVAGNILVATSPTACGWQTQPWSCQTGTGDGVSAIAAQTYPQYFCLNDTGKTVTITSIRCLTDNNGSSSLSVTNGAGTSLLTGPITCSNSWAAGTQSATVTLAAGDYVKFAFTSDGASLQSSWEVGGWHL